MTHLKFSPSESIGRSITSKVAQFEALCTEKRVLGAQIERDILQLEDLALIDVRTAESKLASAKIERNVRIMYLENAYEGFLPSHRKSTAELIPGRDEFTSGKFSAPINPPNAIVTNSLAPLSFPSLLASTAPAVSDSGSISVTSETVCMVEEVIDTDITDCGSSGFDCLDHSSSSMERHKLLCYALLKLDHEIRDEVEEMVLSASRNVSNAKERLKANRKEAAETIDALKKASGGTISIQIPWKNGGGDSLLLIHDNVSMLPHSGSLSPTVIMPAVATFLTLPTLTPRIQTPGIQNHLVTLNVNDERNTPNTPSTSFIHTNEDIFHQYEDKMNSITTRRPQGLWPWDIPWPIFTLSPHSYPPKTCDPLLASDTLEDNLKAFVIFYARWKGRPLWQTRTAMLLDWTTIVDRIPVWMREEKAKAETVVSSLSHIFEYDDVSVYTS